MKTNLTEKELIEIQRAMNQGFGIWEIDSLFEGSRSSTYLYKGEQYYVEEYYEEIQSIERK